MAEMARTKVTPRAKHLEHTQHFVTAVKQALDAFKEQISFTDEEVRSEAYQKLLQAYKEALIPVWNLAGFADIDVILETVSDKEMLGLRTMARQLQPPPTTSKVTKEPRSIPGLETILTALKEKTGTLWKACQTPRRAPRSVKFSTRFTAPIKHMLKQLRASQNCQQRSPLSSIPCY